MLTKITLVTCVVASLFVGTAHAQTATRLDGTQTQVNTPCPKAPKVAKGTELEPVYVTTNGVRYCVWSVKGYTQPKKHEGWLAGAGRCMMNVTNDYQTCINGGPVIDVVPYYGDRGYYGRGQQYTTQYSCRYAGDPNCYVMPAPARQEYGRRY